MSITQITATEDRPNTSQSMDMPWLQAMTAPRRKGRTPRAVAPRRKRANHESRFLAETAEYPNRPSSPKKEIILNGGYTNIISPNNENRHIK
jgi:hypothetical protein